MKKTEEVKLMIIDNFIDYYTTNEAERDSMKNEAYTYVDEVAQSFPETAKPKLTIEQCREIENKVLNVWHRRAKAQGYNPNSKKSRELQAEFLIGMAAALDVINDAEETGESTISPRVLFAIMRGDYIA